MLAMNTKKKLVQKEWEMNFDGDLSPQILSRLVTELIKFILFERQQIPAPLDQLKLQINEKMLPQKKMNKKQKQQLITNFDLISKNIDTAFMTGIKIVKVLVLLGGTVVIPKETYTISLPETWHHEENVTLTTKSCVRNLFRKLISSDLFGELKTISPTNIYILLQAPRNSVIEFFVPKMTLNFDLPMRGNVITLKIESCNSSLESEKETELTQGNLSDFEMSGVEPLNESLNPLMIDSISDNLTNLFIDDHSTADELEPSQENYAFDLFEGNCEDFETDLIWFQAPLRLKGYKDKETHKGGQWTDIWG